MAGRSAAGSVVGAPMRPMVELEVRAGMAPSRRFDGPQLRAPLPTRKTKETKTTAANTRTSMRPNERNWRKITAQG